jgi:general secretion pathway protein G
MSFSATGASGRAMRGFTLIEIMVVVVILGILATLVIPKIMDNPDKARVIKARNDVRQIVSSLNLYRLDHFRYPSGDAGLEALVNPPDDGGTGGSSGYLDKVPKDPWGNNYQYLNPGVRGEIDVLSYGRDGAPGGEGFDADIGSWDLN